MFQIFFKNKIVFSLSAFYLAVNFANATCFMQESADQNNTLSNEVRGPTSDWPVIFTKNIHGIHTSKPYTPSPLTDEENELSLNIKNTPNDVRCIILDYIGIKAKLFYNERSNIYGVRYLSDSTSQPLMLQIEGNKLNIKHLLSYFKDDISRKNETIFRNLNITSIDDHLLSVIEPIIRTQRLLEIDLFSNNANFFLENKKFLNNMFDLSDNIPKNFSSEILLAFHQSSNPRDKLPKLLDYLLNNLQIRNPLKISIDSSGALEILQSLQKAKNVREFSIGDKNIIEILRTHEFKTFIRNILPTLRHLSAPETLILDSELSTLLQGHRLISFQSKFNHHKYNDLTKTFERDVPLDKICKQYEKFFTPSLKIMSFDNQSTTNDINRQINTDSFNSIFQIWKKYIYNQNNESIVRILKMKTKKFKYTYDDSEYLVETFTASIGITEKNVVIQESETKYNSY